MEPERIIEELASVGVGSNWREKAIALVAELSGQHLKMIVDRLLAGLESDEKLLLAAARLASVPIVASSYPELVLKVIDRIRNTEEDREEILEAVPYLLESAVKTIPPEHPESIKLAETILEWCRREPRLCRLLDEYADLIDRAEYIKTLVDVLESITDVEDAEIIVKILNKLVKNGEKLDENTRQKLLDTINKKLDESVLNVSDSLEIIEKLDDKGTTILVIANNLVNKLINKEKSNNIINILISASKIENKLLELLEKNPELEREVFKTLRSLYKAKLSYLQGDIPCKADELLLPLLFKPIKDLRTMDNWEAASRAARIFLEVYLGDEMYRELVNEISELNKIPVYHPWVKDVEIFKTVLSKLDEKLNNIEYICKIGERFMEDIEYRKSTGLFNDIDLSLILVALGFDKLEALSGVLVGNELPEALKRKAEDRFSKLRNICSLIGKCEVSDVLPVMIRLGIVADTLVRGVASSLVEEKSVTPIMGGTLVGLSILSREPLKVSKINLKDNHNCKPVWEKIIGNNYNIYIIFREYNKRQLKHDHCLKIKTVCVEVPSLGELCLRYDSTNYGRTVGEPGLYYHGSDDDDW